MSMTAAKERRTNPSKLHDIIKCEDKETIFEVIQQHCDYVKTPDENGNTLLQSLFKNERLSPNETNDILSVLLDLRLDPNIQNKKGLTVLHSAIAREMKSAIDLLIERGAMQHVTDNTQLLGNTVAHFFINNEYEKYAEVSKLGGRDSIVCDRHSMEKESASFAEYLISKGIDFDCHNFGGESALHLAIKMNLQHILPTLLRHSTDIKFVKKRVNKNLLHLFLEADKPSATVKFPRRYAIEIVEILLHRGVSVDAVYTDDKSALELALRTYKEVEIIDMILDRFTDIHRKNQFGQSLLHRVIQRRLRSYADSQEYLKIVRSLVRKGFDVDCEDESGTRPIHLAFDQIQCVEELLDVLLKGGCDVNAVRRNGQTALYLAIEKCNIPVMLKLIRHGADANCGGKVVTPLILALKKGYLDVVKILLDEGADVNCKDAISGKRPLQLVLGWDCDEKVRDKYMKMLLKGGAYVNARDSEKKSALAQAIASRNSAGVRELLEYGADVSDSCVTREMEHLMGRRGDDVSIRDVIENIVDTVLKHWIKVMAVCVGCSKAGESFTEGTKYQQFYRDCLAERETLKNTLVDGRIALYQWMQMDPNKRCRYVNNEELKSIVHSSVLQSQFPLYSIVVVGNYREAVARKSMLGLAKDAWMEVTGIGLPDICMECIFSYMSNADLVDMM